MVELELEMDLTGYKTISADVYLPRDACGDLYQARIIVVTGLWWFIEQRSPVHLKRGRWNKVEANINVSRESERLKWKCVMSKDWSLVDNLDKVQKIGIRVEYNANVSQAGPPYKGPIYIDNIVLER